LESVLFIFAILVYVLAAVLRLADSSRYPVLALRAPGPALWIGFVAHVGGLVMMAVRLGDLPLRSPAGSMASLSALVAAGFLWTRRNPRAEAVGSFVVPLAIVLLALGLLLPEPSLAPGDAVIHQDWNPWFPIHAITTFLGLSGFAMACGVSVLYLVVRWRLKNKRLAGLARLPSLDALDRMNTRFVMVGFTTLTIGIATGGVWAATSPDRGDAMGPTVVATLIVWAWYALAIQVRVVGGWRGRLAAGFSVVGFMGLVAGLIVINIVSRGWHT